MWKWPVIVVLACMLRAHPAPAVNTEQEIRPGTAVDAPIRVGEVHSYRISLEKNQFLYLTVDQHEADVEVTCYAPDGQRLQRLDARWYGREPAPVIAESSGDYRLEVRALRAGKDAHYVLQAEAPRPRTYEDDITVAAVLASTAVKSLIKENTLESKKKALPEAQRALELWQQAGDRTEQAQSLNSIGYLLEALGQGTKAIDSYRQALTIWRDIGDRAGEGEALHNIAAAYSALGDKAQALKYYEQALPLRRASGDREPLGFTLTNMAAIYLNLGEDDRAADLLAEALPVLRATGNPILEAQAAIALGTSYLEAGETQRALDAYNQALSATRAAADHRGEGYCLGNLGKVYDELGDQQKALEYLNEAVAAMRLVGDKRGEVSILLSSGGIQLSLGKYDAALDLFEQASRITTAVGDRFREPIVLLSIARVDDAKGQPELALEIYQRALSMARTVGDTRTEATCLRNIGENYFRQHRNEEALDCFSKAHTIFQNIGYRAGVADTLLASARGERELGQLSDALVDSQAALGEIESLRTKVAVQDLRISYFASKQSYYRFHIDLLMRLHHGDPTKGFDRAALETSERAHARGLLEMLAEARSDIRQGVDPGLLQEQRSLQHQLNAKASAIRRLPAGKQGQEQAMTIQKDVETIVDQLREVEAKIRAASPRYAALTQPQPLTTSDIQKQLDRSTMLLEYSRGEEHMYLWTVTADSVRSFELPLPEKIQMVTQRLRQLSLQPDTRFQRCAQELAEMLLGPLRGTLGHERLLIVTDAFLRYVPFAALPPSPRGPPLGATHEIVYLPSASIIGTIRSDAGSRRPPPKAVAVFADPVFDADDERLPKNQRYRLRSVVNGDAMRSANELGGTGQGAHIPRLPFTRQEAKEIASVAPRLQSVLYLDFDANRNTVTAPELTQYRIVHFATHAFLNNTHPELSGIVLSLVNRQGAEQDGFIRLNEIYNLKLPVDLVVISACQSGLGKEVEGEGLIGLTRGFLYAGATRVLVSLWKVDDEATAEMMKEFYKAIFLKHIPPAAALQIAQNAMRKSQRWSSPYYWAAFVILGEWR